MAVTVNTALQNAQVDAWGTALNSGFIKIYTGSQPAANTAPTGTLLVSCLLQADAYATASGGSATKNGTVQGTAVANGTAGYAQQVNAAGTQWQYASVSATGGGGDIQLSTLSITLGQVVAFTSSVIMQEPST